MKISEILGKEKAWCKGAPSRDEFGEPCYLSKATSFCILGAAAKAFMTDGNVQPVAYVQAIEKIRDVVKELFPDRTGFVLEWIANFNDHKETSYADIRKVLERAGV